MLKKRRKICRSVAAVLPGVLLCGIFFTGCSRQETIAYFNNIEDTSVGYEIETTEIVDNGIGSGAADGAKETSAIPNPEDAVQAGLAAPVSREDTCAITAKTYSGPEISLVMVGDILLHTPVAESGLEEDGSYNFQALFSNVESEIKNADLALVNQEVMIGGKELGISGYPSFNAPYELGDALADAGFHVVLHATNHALDQGKKGLKNCLNFWSAKHPEMAVLGIFASQKAQDDIYVFEQDGIRVAILNYTYGTNGIALPSDMPYAVNLLEEEQVKEDLAKAEELADFTIVTPHWGTEYSTDISGEQEYWTDLFLENGVDLVIGTHPHVIEPVEWVSDHEGNDMLVYYSLGNFVNWTSGEGEGIAKRMVGGMAGVRIGLDQSGEAFIVDYDIKPLVCHLEEGVSGVTTYFLEDYTEELAQKNEIKKQDSTFSLESCWELCEEVWGDVKSPAGQG